MAFQLDTAFATDCVAFVMRNESIQWEPIYRRFGENISPFKEKILPAAKCILKKFRVKLVQIFHDFSSFHSNKVTMFQELVKMHGHYFVSQEFDLANLLFYCLELSLYCALSYRMGVYIAPRIAIKNISLRILQYRECFLFIDRSYEDLQQVAEDIHSKLSNTEDSSIHPDVENCLKSPLVKCFKNENSKYLDKGEPLKKEDSESLEKEDSESLKKDL